MKKIHLFISAALLIGLSVSSCKKELNVAQDSVTPTLASNSTAYLQAIVLGTYTKLQGLTANNAMLLTSEETSDALIVPGRIGGDWADGGVWQQLWLHTYGPGHSNITGAWDDAYNTIGQINITINLLQGLPQTTSTAYSISELKVLRAYYYFQLVTNYGGVPLLISTTQDASKVTRSSASDVYTFLVSELTTNGPKLTASTPAQDPAQYGRLNRWGAYFLLAKVYLNKNVITGSTDLTGYTSCNQYCDSIMTAGYSLQSNFLDNFVSNNTGSNENIFVIPYDHISAPTLNIQMMTFHYNQATKYNFSSTGGPWNGFTTTADYYSKFDNADSRKAGWQAGQQFAADGVTPLTTRGSDSTLALNFRPQISNLYTASERDGVRQQKWQITPGFQGQDADFALMRYSDVLLMKAECQYRLGNIATSLTFTAPVRLRAKLTNFTAAAFNLDSILAERGREFVWEGWRKQDLIRFGHFGDKKQFKAADADNHAQLFPIPQTARQKNPNLVQNPGYN
ncbi:MAG: RagB/SusD family nutrient uptake outer membrane protein [Sphingobacteriaceae bacterium]|nr:MAG: RagB/SusD family nutrient uptake outer membrane protein [Sphingobacteriaceae bacterium]